MLHGLSQSQVSCLFQNPHFIMFTLDRPVTQPVEYFPGCPGVPDVAHHVVPASDTLFRKCVCSFVQESIRWMFPGHSGCVDCWLLLVCP